MLGIVIMLWRRYSKSSLFLFSLWILRAECNIGCFVSGICAHRSNLLGRNCFTVQYFCAFVHLQPDVVRPRLDLRPPVVPGAMLRSTRLHTLHLLVNLYQYNVRTTCDDRLLKSSGPPRPASFSRAATPSNLKLPAAPSASPDRRSANASPGQAAKTATTAAK